MPINTISLITGALSFSAALAWNKAINDALTTVSGINNSSLVQAVLITLVIIITVIIINSGIHIYKRCKRAPLQDHILKAGKNPGLKVNLWL